MKLKFGDIVVNEWAGDANPQKALMVRKITRKRVYCIALDGERVEFYNGDGLRLNKVGKLDMTTWQAFAANL